MKFQISNFKFQIDLQKILSFLIKVFLFLLPWQTIYIYRETFINGTKVEPLTLGFYGTEILLWVIFFLFIIWYWRQFKFQVTKDRIFLLSCLLFTFYFLLSTVWAIDKQLALQQSLRVMEAILLFIVIYIGPFEKKSLIKWLLAGAIIPGLLGIWQFVMQSSPDFKWLGLVGHAGWENGASIVSGGSLGRVLRAYGTFTHPNVFGGYLAIIIVVWLCGYLIDRFQISNFKFQNATWRFVVYSLLPIPLFLTFSRSALLAVFIFLPLYFFLLRIPVLEKMKRFFIFVSPIIILILILIPVLAVRVSDASSYEVRSLDERMTGLSDAKNIILQNHNLWLGVGAGNYVVALYQTNPNLAGWQYQPVHNVLILFFAEEGLVGVLLLLFVMVSFFMYHISCIMYQTRRYIFCYMIYVLCFMILASFDHYLYSSFIGLILSAVYWGLLLKFDVELAKN